MPVDKNKEERLLVLDRILSSKRCTKEELLDKVNEQINTKISSRTLSNDLRYIGEQLENKYPNDYQKVGFATEKEGKKKLWYYQDKSTSIFNQLTAYQAKQLEDLLQLIESAGSASGIDHFQQTLQELKKRFNLHNKPSIQIMQMEQNDKYAGKRNIAELYNAIADEQTLEIEYKAFHREEEDSLIISPKLLKEYNNRWFLFGWNHEKERIWNLALDRIQDVRNSKESFKKHNMEGYFQHIYGVSKPENAELKKIVLKFSEKTFPYIETKPIHTSQKVNYTDQTVSVELFINYEIKQLICSYGKDVEVLEPLELRDEIKEQLGINLRPV